MRLRDWQVSRSLTDRQVTDLLNRWANGPAFSLHTVRKWLRGDAVPRRRGLTAVIAATEGLVLEGDFRTGERSPVNNDGARIRLGWQDR